MLGVPGEGEHIPLAVVGLPRRLIKDVPVYWDVEVCMTLARCISLVLRFTRNADMTSTTIRFAAETIWHPEITQILSP